MLIIPNPSINGAHCLKLELTDTTTLQSLGLQGMQDVSIRVNICSTGVVNFFVGLPGGEQLSSDPELRVISMCETLLQAIHRRLFILRSLGTSRTVRSFVHRRGVFFQQITA